MPYGIQQIQQQQGAGFLLVLYCCCKLMQKKVLYEFSRFLYDSAKIQLLNSLKADNRCNSAVKFKIDHYCQLTERSDFYMVTSHSSSINFQSLNDSVPPRAFQSESIVSFELIPPRGLQIITILRRCGSYTATRSS